MGSAMTAAARIREVTQAQPDMQDPAHPRGLPQSGALELDGVTFRYPARSADPSPTVLDGIQLHVDPGERVAILAPAARASPRCCT